MKIFLTGSTGMVGRSVLEHLKSRSTYEVVSPSRNEVDLAVASEVKQALLGESPDLVIHAAARVGGIHANIERPFEFLSQNLNIDSNVINAAIHAQVPSLLYLGSSCMYPKDFRQPLLETDLLAAPVEKTNEGYALAKISGSKLCEFASKQFGVSYRTIVPSNLYGPGDNFNPTSSHLVASVLRKVHEAKLSNRKVIEVWGTGKARREFTFVGDLARWIAEHVTSIASLPNLLNLGYGRDFSVDYFYEIAMKTAGYDAELRHDLAKPDGMKAKLMSSQTARELFDWEPEVDLEMGMEITYQWLLENLREIEKI